MYREGPIQNLRTGRRNHAIRSLEDENGDIWLIAMDVAELFDVRTVHMMRMVRSENKMQIDLRNRVIANHLIRGRGNVSRIWLITPRGMSHIILRSRHPLAMEINDWMYDTVLPSLITYGKHIMDDLEFQEIRADMARLTEEVELLRAENRILWEHSDMRARDLIDE